MKVARRPLVLLAVAVSAVVAFVASRLPAPGARPTPPRAVAGAPPAAAPPQPVTPAPPVEAPRPIAVSREVAPVWGAAWLLALAIAGGTFCYWAAARTPLQPVSSNMIAAMDGVTALFAFIAFVYAAAAAAILTTSGSSTGPAAIARRDALRLTSAPPWLTVLPVTMAASLFAGKVALTSNFGGNYWPALYLWAGSVAVFFTAFLPLDAVRRPAGWLRSLWRWETVLVLSLLALALTVRAVKLDAAPVLAHVDEEAIGQEALFVVEGQLKNMFTSGWGALPTLSFFLYAPFLKLFGIDLESVRLASAVSGAIGVPLVYLLLRELFGKEEALLGALFLVAFHIHLHFSRAGLNVAWDTAMVAAALFFAYRAGERGRAFDFAAAGGLSGFALYLYHGTRIVPLLVLSYFVWVAVFKRGFLRANAGNLALTLLAFFLVAMPMGMFFLTHQDIFWGRANATTIFASGWYDQQIDAGRSSVEIFWDQTVHAFGGYVYYGEQSPFSLYNANVPLVAGLAAIPFIAGLAYSALHIDDRRYALLLIAFAVPTVLGGVFVVGPNSGQRYMGAVPSICAFVAIGLWQTGRLIFFWRKELLAPAAIVVVVALGAWNADFYFDAARNELRYGGLVHHVATRYVDTLPPDTRVYWYGLPLISSYLAPVSLHDRNIIEVYEAAPQAVTPVESASPSVYVFMPHRVSLLEPLQDRCPGGDVRVVDFRGSPVLTAYELMGANRCAPEVAAPDDFAEARVIPSGVPDDFLWAAGASLEEGEPRACGVSTASVWYSYTPPKDFRVRATTAGSDFDTVLGVYTGDSLETLERVACNDDNGADVAALVQFDAEAGTTYYLQVGAGARAPDPSSLGNVHLNLVESSF